jgi:hypothetical protein
MEFGKKQTFSAENPLIEVSSLAPHQKYLPADKIFAKNWPLTFRTREKAVQWNDIRNCTFCSRAT